MRALAPILAAVLATPAVATESSQLPSWEVERNTDELRDSERVYSGIMLDDRSVIVRCQQGRMSVMLNMGRWIGISRDTVTVRYRLDGGEIKSADWIIGSDGASVFAPNALPVALNLQQHESVVFELESPSGTRYQQSFPLRGARPAIEQAKSACGF